MFRAKDQPFSSILSGINLKRGGGAMGRRGGEGVGGGGEQSLLPICLTSMKKPIQNRVKTFSIRKVAFYC